MTAAPLLEARGLTKSFGGALALDGVDLTVLPGEVHGLLGENGSGKSTLIKILAGYHVPDAGTLSVAGHDVRLPLRPGEYRELGFDGTAPSSLWSLAPDVVVQAGTTSKTFFPGVRLGWAVGPSDVVAQLVSAKQNTDQCAGALGQLARQFRFEAGAAPAEQTIQRLSIGRHQ